MIKHYRERGDLGHPDKKRCNRCHQWKFLPDDFYLKPAVKLKSGIEKKYFDSLCKTCRVAYNREYMESMTPEERSAKWRRYRENWIARLGEEEVRRRERERKAIYRDKNGLPPSSRPVIDEKDLKVPLKPLVNFIEGEMEERGLLKSDVARASNVDPSHLDRLLAEEEIISNGKKKGQRRKLTHVGLGIVDKILLGLDREFMLTILYSDEVVNAAN